MKKDAKIFENQPKKNTVPGLRNRFHQNQLTRVSDSVLKTSISAAC
jgi:hypothetical protein